jgi:hypothetical protein
LASPPLRAVGPFWALEQEAAREGYHKTNEGVIGGPVLL